MEDCSTALHDGWSWEENKRFEIALAVVEEKDPDRWKVVSSMLGGKRSPEEVRRHYVMLVDDLKCIESGRLDYKLGVFDGEECEQNSLVRQMKFVRPEYTATRQSML